MDSTSRRWWQIPAVEFCLTVVFLVALVLLLCAGILLIPRADGSGLGGYGRPYIPVSVTEAQGDQSRQGTYPEFQLNQANVNSSTFGRLGTYTADGKQVYSQPLFVQGVNVGGSQKDLIIVNTMANSVFAYDANLNSGSVWSQNFGSIYSAYPGAGNSNDALYDQPVGCVSTPAADVAQGWLFTVCTNLTGQWTLRKLALSSGAVLSSTLITGQVAGTGMMGDTVVGGQLQFFSAQELQRASLLIANGNVYIAFCSYGDTSPWHGWVFAYSESSLSQTAVWCSTPNGKFGGIWLGGGAPAVDASGNIYVSTGNGDYDGSTNFGDSAVKLSPSLAVLDWYTPSDQGTDESNDKDLGSSRVILYSGLAIFQGKDFKSYAVQQSCMGHLQGSSACANQVWSVSGAGFGIFGGANVLNGQLFTPGGSAKISQFPYAAGSFTNTGSPTQSASSFPHPGAMLSGSWNGNPSSAILWAVTVASAANATPQPGTLRAFNPSTMVELYDSDQAGGDTLGTLAKLTAPLVVNGRVYVSTGDGTIAIYGRK